MVDTPRGSLWNAAKKLVHMINLERQEVKQIYFSAVLSGLIQLSLPLGTQSIIGLLFGGVFSASLVILICLVVSGVLLSGLIQTIQMEANEKVQQRIFTRVTFNYAYRIPRINLLSMDNLYLPEMVNRFFEITTLQKGLSKLMLDLPTATIQILFGLIVLSFYHPIFILFGIFLVVVIGLTFYLGSEKGFATSVEESDYKYKVAHWLQEISRAVKTFKLSQESKLHLKKTDKLAVGYLNARTAHFRVLVFHYRVLIIFKILITAGMLIIGTLLFFKQQINLGQFVAVEIIVIAVLGSAEKLILGLETIYDVLTSVEKVEKIRKIPMDDEIQLLDQSTAEIQKNYDPTKGLALSVRNIRFAYNPGHFVINELSLNISPGEKICLNGVAGSGKTTLIRIIAGYYTQYTGQIRVNGIPLQSISSSEWRSRVAIFFAQEELFSGTLWENLTLGNETIHHEIVDDVCEMVGLSSFLDVQETGYQTIVDPQGHKLSSSVALKILLARCFLMKPVMLLMENGWQTIEDEFRSKIVNKLIKDKSFCLIAVSDLAEFASACDRVITLESGKIIDPVCC